MDRVRESRLSVAAGWAVAVATALGHSHAVGVGESAHELGNVHST